MTWATLFGSVLITKKHLDRRILGLLKWCNFSSGDSTYMVRDSWTKHYHARMAQTMPCSGIPHCARHLLLKRRLDRGKLPARAHTCMYERSHRSREVDPSRAPQPTSLPGTATTVDNSTLLQHCDLGSPVVAACTADSERNKSCSVLV